MVAGTVQEAHTRLALFAMADPHQQPPQSWVSRSTDFLVQHDDIRELLPHVVCFVVFAPRLQCETTFLVTWNGRIVEEDGPLLDRKELVEVPIEEDNGDPSETLRGLLESTELFIQSIQSLIHEQANLLDDPRLTNATFATGELVELRNFALVVAHSV